MNAAASNPAAELTGAEAKALRQAFERDKWAGEWNSLPTAVDRLLADRAARLAAGGAATDEGLRARVEALCQGWESWGAGVTQECAAMLRDVLDAVPAPTEATTTERRLVRRGKCTCGEVTPENHWGHADGCRYFADSVYEDVPVSRAADTAAEEPRTEAQHCESISPGDSHACGGHRSEAQIKAEAWDEGYEAAEHMARCWGHIDHWEDEPANPYRADEEAGS